MGSYSYDNRPEKKRRSMWLIGCASSVVVISCVVIFLIVGGFAGLVALFGGDPEGLSVDVSVPSSQVYVGDPFTIEVTLRNEGLNNISVDEIKLPNDLLENALVTAVDPIGILGMNYGKQTAYNFDMLIAPNGQETIVFSFEAINTGDINSSIEVQVGTKMNTTRMRLVISPRPDPVVTENDATPAPLLAEVIPYQSVVQIIAMIESDGQKIEAWFGSGTIISDDGLILTNDHVVSDPYITDFELVVAVTDQQDQPPVPMFYADVLQADYYLDLAVIKIRSDLEGNPVNLSEFNFQPVPFGSSDDLQLGDPLIIIGYPGIGGQTITLTRGEVSGFTAEDPYGNRAFIKTSATIAGGNSGGLAATPQGEIVGVPTQLGSGDIEAGFVDCRTLVDTNRDGVIDENDHCIPLGGFINAVRPITLAQPMIAAAKAGEVAINRPDQQAHEEYEMEGDVLLEDNFLDNANDWNLGVGDDGSTDIYGGQLVIDVNRENYMFWSTMPGTYDGVVVASEVSLNKPAGDGEFGLVCGYRDMDNFTILMISEDGYYSIYKYENDEVIFFVEWTYSDFVAESNTYMLAAYCGSDSLAFALNDVLLAEAYDPNFISGEVGVIASCYENVGLTVGFDSYYIIQP
jgi:S1-C subfamily serine protease